MNMLVGDNLCAQFTVNDNGSIYERIGLAKPCVPQGLMNRPVDDNLVFNPFSSNKTRPQ